MFCHHVLVKENFSRLVSFTDVIDLCKESSYNLCMCGWFNPCWNPTAT
ncbi:unnamed protein product [Linum tenue]|uniref:Uncharacterized protein n=1 Tax=Linum tenue TaxID=586396 RepID=A0AAV0L0U7_9ROSI|nr:unnamed protein product [Linum tenue]